MNIAFGFAEYLAIAACSAHTQCDSDEYCDTEGACFACDACAIALDAFNGTSFPHRNWDGWRTLLQAHRTQQNH